jgi:hypothetical protein
MALASSEALALSESSHLPELLFSTERSLAWWVVSCLAGPLVRPGMAAMLWFSIEFGVVLGAMGVMEVFEVAMSLDGMCFGPFSNFQSRSDGSEEGAIESMGLALTSVARSSCLYSPHSMPQYSIADSYLRGM